MRFERKRPPLITLFLWIIGAVTILMMFQWIFTYAPAFAKLKGGVDLFDYLIALQMLSLGVTQISVDTLIDIHSK